MPVFLCHTETATRGFGTKYCPKHRHSSNNESGEHCPVDGNNPGEGMSADHKGTCVLELVDIGQFSCPLPEDPMGCLITIACILDVGDKEHGE